MKKGFTIVELLMVVAIIAILLGIVTTAASSSVRMSRERKSVALCRMVQSGLEVYYAQKDEWPISTTGLKRDEGAMTASLSADQVRSCVRQLVMATKEGNPMMDISGLFVSRSDGEPKVINGRHYPKAGYGMDFMTAIRGTKRSPKKMKVAEMYFGYPDTNTGRFMRFCMSYNFATDQITVGRWSN